MVDRRRGWKEGNGLGVMLADSSISQGCMRLGWSMGVKGRDTPTCLNQRNRTVF